jgi:hypothetical protein
LLIALIQDRKKASIEPTMRFITPRLIVRESCGASSKAATPREREPG